MRCGLVIGSHRLFAAADFLLGAIESETGMASVVPMRLDNQYSSRLGSQGVYTQTELVEAMAMLVRMGFVQPVSRPPVKES